jgi:hypothetical protein
VLSMVWRKMLDPEEVSFLVCVPKAFLLDMKTDVMDQLKARDSGNWVGSSDVLLAWWYKVIWCSAESHWSDQCFLPDCLWKSNRHHTHFHPHPLRPASYILHDYIIDAIHS